MAKSLVYRGETAFSLPMPNVPADRADSGTEGGNWIEQIYPNADSAREKCEGENNIVDVLPARSLSSSMSRPLTHVSTRAE